jgi:hypothetical protein
VTGSSPISGVSSLGQVTLSQGVVVSTSKSLDFIIYANVGGNLSLKGEGTRIAIFRINIFHYQFWLCDEYQLTLNGYSIIQN